MKKSTPKSKAQAALRKKAEKKLKEQIGRLGDLSAKDTKRLAHELGTYQIELETQNEELLQARTEREEAHAKYADLYEFAPVGYFTMDRTGKIMEVNVVGSVLLGTTKSHLINAPFSMFVHSKHLPLFRSHLETVVDNRTVEDCEIRLKKKDGSMFYALLHSMPYEDREGTTSLMRTAVSDMTHRKKSEESLRESEERYRSLVELSPDAILIHAGGKYIYSNPAGLGLFGAKESGELLNRNVMDLVHPDYKDIVENRIKHSYLRRVPAPRTETKILRLDGTPVDVEAISTPISYKGKAATQVILRDVTERVKAEEALRRANEELESRVEHRTSQLKFLNQRLAAQLSERKKAEKTVSMQSQILDSLFRYMITPLVLLDREFNFIRVNAAYAQVCAKEISDFPGHNHFEFYPHGENEAIFRRVVETKTSYLAIAKAFEFPDHPEWGVTYWDWTLTPLLDEKGEVEYLIFSLNDVTDRKRAEQELLNSEHKYRTLIQQAADGIVLADRDLNVVDANPAAYSMLGFTREEMLKLNVRNILPPGELAEKPLRIEEVLSGKTVIMERTALRKDGSPIDIDVSAKLIEGGLIQAIFRDISERKKERGKNRFITSLLELFAKKTSRKIYLDSVVAMLHEWTGCRHVGIRIVNKERYVPYVSYTGFSEEFMRLENMISLDSDTCACIRVFSGRFEPQDVPAITPAGSFRLDNSLKFAEQLTEEEVRRFRGNCIRSGYKSIAVIPIRYHDQPLGAVHLADEEEGKIPLERVQFLESVAVPLIGEAIYKFSTEEELEKHRHNLEELVEERTDQLKKANEELGKEISMREQTEKELNELAGELRRSNTDLEQFAYAASHDLQEPLRVVAGFVKLLEKRYEGKLDEKAREYIDYTVDGVKRMQLLINDLLAYSQVDTKGKAFKPVNCSVSLEESLYNLRSAVGETGAKVTYDLLPTVAGDASQLTRLFQNLIGNALKFRGERNPQIHVSASKEGETWVFSIKDNGIGIDPEYFNRVFVVFQRLHTREEYEGTGIGLAICKKIVERHHGHIWIESEVDKGSTFYFTIPASKTE